MFKNNRGAISLRFKSMCVELQFKRRALLTVSLCGKILKQYKLPKLGLRQQQQLQYQQQQSHLEKWLLSIVVNGY